MQKVAILTLNGYYNYGNRLQNYALQEKIKSLGFEVETILNNNTKFKKYHKDEKFTKKIKSSLGVLKNKVVLNPKVRTLQSARTKEFVNFSNNYINESNFFINEKNIKEFNHNNYKFFVTGSDQVWNPHYRKGSPLDFLTFAPKEKRVAYAPSFGVTDIPTIYRTDYKKWLEEMKSLSVREEAGANIIRSLTGREAPVVIDPTLLLSKEEWLKVSQTPINKPKNAYLLTYFLSKITKERKDEIKRIAALNNLEIVNLAKITSPDYYVTGPSEFIDYINSASVVLTDSFHGTVFSILLERPFIVYNRTGSIAPMNSRIDTLTSKFKLEDRKAEVIKDSKIFDYDYSHTKAILKSERAKATDYLNRAMSTS